MTNFEGEQIIKDEVQDQLTTHEDPEAEKTATQHPVKLQRTIRDMLLVELPPERPPTFPLSDQLAMWLTAMSAGVGTLPTDVKDQWRQREEIEALPEFRHYRRLDELFGKPMLWRFTSCPQQERIHITATGNNLAHVMTVIGQHAAKHEKADVDVKLQSCARNLGTFIGTSMSSGGDKLVRYVINNAMYLYGFEIDRLAAMGVCAQPALAKPICFVETEYVLVPLPQQPPISMDALATVKYLNPFRHKLPPKLASEIPWVEAEVRRRNRNRPIQPEPGLTTQLMPDSQVKEVLRLHEATLKVAETGPVSVALRDNEYIAESTYATNVAFAGKFATALAEELKKPTRPIRSRRGF